MNRILIALALGAVFCVSEVAHAAPQPGDGLPVYWVGGDGEWTGNFDAVPAYSTGQWSATADGSSGLFPALKALGRNDGIRIADVPAAPAVRLGTEVIINTGATVTYNGNLQIVPPNTGATRHGDWRMSPANDLTDPARLALGSLTISNGSTLTMGTTDGTDDGNWTRWNLRTMTLDNGTFDRFADHDAGSSGGALMMASYHGYDNSEQFINLINGGKFKNDGQLWFGISGFDLGEESHKGVKITMTINNGHLDLTGGDSFELDNDGLPLEADLAFIYDWQLPGEKEQYIINFTGPGDITVDAGGIRIAEMVDSGVLSTRNNHVGHHVGTYGTDGTTQRSYLDLWNKGILQAKGKSGLTGDTFTNFFSVTNSPGQVDYKLTSLVVPGVEGDYNNNGVVDAADYVVWRNGDSPDDGAPGYNLWKANFGKTAGSGSSAGVVGAVPEPGTMVLMIAGLAFFLGGKRSRVG